MFDGDYLSKSVFIVDVDGTLYDQKALRMYMARKLMGHYIMHPFHMKELYGIYMFRKLREQDAYKSYSIDALCDVVSDKVKLAPEKMKATVQYWMFDFPLEAIAACARKDLINELRAAKERGSIICIYSDYPANDKIKALGMDAVADEVFCAEDEAIGELKPSQKAMEHIASLVLKRYGESRNLTAGDYSQFLFIGDRDEKDGASAAILGMDYVNVRNK